MGRSTSVEIPFPVGGWNARDSLAAMGPLDAETLENVIPRGTYGEVIDGDETFYTSGSGANNNVGTLISYTLADGTKKLIGANENSGSLSIGVVTASTWTNLTTVLSSNEIYQHTIFKNTLIMVNGSDDPFNYDGTTLSQPTYSGSGLTISDLIDVTGFKSRLYFVEKDSTSFWYGGVSAITGALTEFDVGEFLTRGGSIKWIDSLSQDTGLGLQDFLVIMSDQGEMLIYEGSDPGSTWVQAGRFYVGKPLGRRAKGHVGSDLLMLTEEGCLSATEVIRRGDQIGNYIAYTDKIQNAYRDAVAGAVGTSEDYKWQVVHIPHENLVLINCPVASSTTTFQFVVNTETGGWYKQTITGIHAWCVHDGAVYTGNASFQIVSKQYADPDSENFNLVPKVRWAYNYLGDRSRNKFVSGVKVIAEGDEDLAYAVGLDTDFQNTAFDTGSLITGSGGTDTYVERFTACAAYGRAFALKIAGTFQDTPQKIFTARLLFEPSREVF